MVLELPTTLMDLSVMDNAMARMMLETINNMMLELYASMAQAEAGEKGEATAGRDRSEEIAGRMG